MNPEGDRFDHDSAANMRRTHLDLQPRFRDDGIGGKAAGGYLLDAAFSLYAHSIHGLGVTKTIKANIEASLGTSFQGTDERRRHRRFHAIPSRPRFRA